MISFRKGVFSSFFIYCIKYPDFQSSFKMGASVRKSRALPQYG
ncbi:hypothetical protein D932_02929 [Enterococcus casseliflavus 14-MB-W-14]|nr:hypothetical protein D932_02929 [Enterococcus casseliflavus 14-MB-W-14]